MVETVQEVYRGGVFEKVVGGDIVAIVSLIEAHRKKIMDAAKMNQDGRDNQSVEGKKKHEEKNSFKDVFVWDMMTLKIKYGRSDITKVEHQMSITLKATTIPHI